MRLFPYKLLILAANDSLSSSIGKQKQTKGYHRYVSAGILIALIALATAAAALTMTLLKLNEINLRLDQLEKKTAGEALGQTNKETSGLFFHHFHHHLLLICI